MLTGWKVGFWISTCQQFNLLTFAVRMEGLEPPHLTASDPKSDVSTNFTTSGNEMPKNKFQIPIQTGFVILPWDFVWGCKCRAFWCIWRTVLLLIWVNDRKKPQIWFCQFQKFLMFEASIKPTLGFFTIQAWLEFDFLELTVLLPFITTKTNL